MSTKPFPERKNEVDRKDIVEHSKKSLNLHAVTIKSTSKDGQLMKCIRTAAQRNPSLCKDYCQQKRLSSNSPYQSHQGAPHLDLHLAAKNNLSSFTQRVMSAKLLRLKQLQNQLAETNLQLNELYTENRLLRALQKRQDLALDRYEGTQAQLPQLVNSHHEEVRILRARYRNLKAQYRDVSKKLKDRDAELLNLKEQNSHLLKLSQDRHLGERETLNKQLLELQSTVNNQKNTIQVLNRKVLLETKNLKHQLHVEMQRHKATQLELQETLLKIEGLQSQLEQTKERQGIPLSMQRPGKPASLLCSRLPGLRRRSATLTTETNQQGNLEHHSHKLKSSFLDYSLQNIPPTTDPSSDQPDSSVATFSEKTNEYSTSMDSSPEHATDIINSSDASSTAPLQNTLIIHPNIEPNTPRRADTLLTGDLDAEYKKALEMLSELTSKDRGDFSQELSNSLSSTDSITAKHVAALPNVTFSVEGTSRERSSSFGPTVVTCPNKPDDPLRKAVSQGKHVKESNSNSFERGKRTLVSMSDDALSSKENSTLDISLLIETRQEKSTRMPWDEHVPIISEKTTALENSAQDSFDKNISNNSHSPLQEDDEDFHKEALLKALKAIDDESVLLSKNDSESDEGDTNVTKLTSRTSRGQGLPVSKFTSNSSSGSAVKRTLQYSSNKIPFK